MFDKRKAEKAEKDHAAATSAAAYEAHLAHDAWQASTLQQTIARVDGVMLKKGETAYLSIGGAGLVEPRRAPGQSSGGSHGVSLRVAKGMSYRVGQSRGTYTQGAEQPTVIDHGTFVVTDQRCVFVGSKRSTEWAFSKLLGFSLEGDSVAIFNVSNRQKASGVTYPPQRDHLFDAIVASAIAKFSSADQHDALVAELAAEYATVWQTWNVLQSAPGALSPPQA
jgi:hypothetical protein